MEDKKEMEQYRFFLLGANRFTGADTHINYGFTYSRPEFRKTVTQRQNFFINLGYLFDGSVGVRHRDKKLTNTLMQFSSSHSQ